MDWKRDNSDNTKMTSPRSLRITLVRWTKSVLNGDFSCVSAVFFIVLVIFLFTVLFTVKRKPTVITSLAKTHVDWGELEKHSVNTILIEHEDGHVYLAFKINASSKLVSDIRQGKLAIEKSVISLDSIRKRSDDDTDNVKVDNELVTHSDDHDAESERKEKTTDSKVIPGYDYPITTLNDPYTINCLSVCSKFKQLSIIVLVHSSTTHFMRRSSIRETWANYQVYKGHSLRIVFLLGQPERSTTQTLIEHEFSVHGDIIQGKFVDSYRNLTHKGVMGLRWVVENCKQARFVLKVDDDVFVNVFKVMEHIDIDFKNKTRQIWCPVRYNGTSLIQRGKGKWVVENQEFKNLTHFPFTYCNGFFTIISSDIIQEMYQAAKVTRFFWIDDVYLFGLLPFKIGKVTHTPLMNLNLVETKAIACFENKTKQCEMLVANAHTEGIMDKFWFSALNQYKNLAKKYSSDYLVV